MKKFLYTLYNNPALLFCVVALWLSLEYFILGPFSYLLIYEWGDGNLPHHVVLFRDLIKYGISYWSPYLASGADYFVQDSSYTQLHGVFLLLLPTWFVTPAITLLRFFLSGYFMYHIARDHLELPKNSALFASISFSLSHLSFPSNLFSYSLVPMFLWILDILLEKKKRGLYTWPFLILLATIFSLSSSVAGSLPFTLPFIFVWLVLLRKRRSPKEFVMLLVFCLMTIVLQIPTIWALLANAGISHRIHASLSKTFSLVPWENLASFKKYVINFFSVYLLPWKRFDHRLLLPLTLLAIFSHRFKNKKLNFVFICLLLTTVGNMFLDLLKFGFYDYFGPFKSFHFKRFYYITHLFYPLCAAFTFEKLPNKFHLRRVVLIVAFLTLFFNSLLFKKEHLSFWLDGASYTYVYNNQELKKLKKLLDQNEMPFRVATVSDNHPETYMEPSLVNVYGLESADGYLNMYPKRYQQFWLKVIEPLKNKYNYYDIVEENGNKIYLFLPEDRERYSTSKFKNFFHLNLLSLANVKYILSSSVAPIEDPNLVLVSKADYPIPQNKDLALPTRLKKTFLQRDSSLSQEETMTMLRSRLREIFSTGQDLLIYENKAALPRFFLVPKAKGFPDSVSLLKAMATTSPADFKREVLTEQQYLTHAGALGFKRSSIEVNKYSPDEIELSVQLDGNGILIVSNTYSPFWKVTVDGKEKTIFPAYHTFWGVSLAKGDHRVAFEYKPPYKIF